MSGRRVRLTFEGELVRRPVLADLARGFAVKPNIRRASVDEDTGWLVCELEGEPGAVDAALAWLEGLGVVVTPLADAVEG